MTANQIAYQNLLENQRANRAKEDENVRHNVATEYNQLISALDNIYSLASHAAKGESSAVEGLKNQISSAFGETSPITTIFGGLSDSIVKQDTGPILDALDSVASTTVVEPLTKVAESKPIAKFMDRIRQVFGDVGNFITSIYD